MNILVTGSSGFLGARLVSTLIRKSAYEVSAVVRRKLESHYVKTVIVPDCSDETAWSHVVRNQRVIIHCAARAHVMNDSATDPLTEYRNVNVGGTLKLARQAAAVGVKRFIFISSIKVNGDQSPKDHPFTELDVPNPVDAYGLSKWEAEQGLLEIAVETGMEVVIIRPSLVYGPGVKGNFASMIALLGIGLPLPFGTITNKRSFVGVDNLIDLIITCIAHPAAANQVFLASDGHDLSTTNLLRGVACAMGKPARLIPVPSLILMFGLTCLGKNALAQRALGSLQLDISKARKLLGWMPPISVEEGLRRCFVKE